MSDLPTTRQEARARSLKRFFTGKPCKHGHVAERYTNTGDCVECGREAARKWAEANREKAREAARKWAEANREKARAQSRKWNEANPEKVRENNRQWRAANREKEREQSRKWREANPEKRAAQTAARRARQISATPPWSDLKAIEAIYAECARVTSETGIEHHVDHIAPLKGRNVCGLHVPWNLQVIPATENIAKGNKVVAVWG